MNSNMNRREFLQAALGTSLSIGLGLTLRQVGFAGSASGSLEPQGLELWLLSTGVDVVPKPIYSELISDLSSTSLYMPFVTK